MASDVGRGLRQQPRLNLPRLPAAKLLKIHNLVWYDQPGFDNFIIANADTVMSCPSTDLMAEYFPRTEVRSPLEGTQALCSIDKARRLLGWEPRHTWRDHVSA